MVETSKYAHHPGLKPNPLNVPKHVAIIMDGNGRWAKGRSMSRTSGHRRGVEVARDVIYACLENKIEVLTLFAFGTENWKRPSKEVRNLFRLFFLALRKEINRLSQDNIKLRVIGDRSIFHPGLIAAISQAETLTQNNTGLLLNIAVNYSGRWDILNAMQNAFEKCRDQPRQLEANFYQALSLQGSPEPDLFIRTGGVQRLSNFMLWELAYTELYFTQTLWPDFTIQELEHALEEYAKRERRFGLTGEQL